MAAAQDIAGKAKTMDRRAFLASMGAAAVGAGCLPRQGGAGQGRGGRRPNVVFVVSDDQTREDAGCYGAKAVRTPNLDRLATEGMLFRNAFTATAMCVPSRATLYTGLYPMRHGAWPNHSRVYDATRSLPHYLRPLGYRVAVAGKTHFSPRECFPFEILPSPQDVTNLRLDKVERFLADAKGTPFCLFVCTSDPHVPWPDETACDPTTVSLPPYLVDTPATRKWFARYYAEVTRADRLLGAVDALLEKHGLAGDTLLVYTSDQGGQWPYAKWTLYDAGIAVPFVARWPGRIRRGAVTDAMVSFADVVPTLVDLAGGTPVEGLDGRSFLPVLLGQADDHHEAIFATSSRDGSMNDYPARAVRTKTHKLIVNLAPDREFTTHITQSPKLNAAGLEYWPEWQAKARTDPEAATLVEGYLHRPAEELYDLRADPFERHNLAADPAHRTVLDDLRRRLRAWMKQQGDEGLATEAKSQERMKRRGGTQRPPRGMPAAGGAPPAAVWRYTLSDPGKGWEAPGFDDSGWKQGKSGFGRIRQPAARVTTPWTTPAIWLRRTFQLAARLKSAVLRIFHDEDAEVYLNGRRIATLTGYVQAYRDLPLDAVALALLQPGDNLLAVHCRQTSGGQYIDAVIVAK